MRRARSNGAYQEIVAATSPCFTAPDKSSGNPADVGGPTSGTPHPRSA
jgi:hypothetical protein